MTNLGTLQLYAILRHYYRKYIEIEFLKIFYLRKFWTSKFAHVMPSNIPERTEKKTISILQYILKRKNWIKLLLYVNIYVGMKTIYCWITQDRNNHTLWRNSTCIWSGPSVNVTFFTTELVDYLNFLWYKGKYVLPTYADHKQHSLYSSVWYAILLKNAFPLSKTYA